MKAKKIFVLLMFLITGWILVPSAISAQGPAKDTAFFNNNGAGIPNSGNTLNPNNGPEFPHSAPLNPSTDPGPLWHGSDQGGQHDSIPDPQKGSHSSPPF
jgi:hypothetical protein